MKKSELTSFIKEEILSTLEEATIETSPQNLSKVKSQAKDDDVIKVVEATKGHRDDLGDSLSESLNPEVIKAVDRFIKAMAKRYGYGEQDAVFAIQAALKQREFDKPADPFFEGTIREDEDDDLDAKAIKQAKGARGKHKKLDIALKSLKSITAEMKSLAREYSKADGVEKEKIKDKLKKKTPIKKELEAMVAKLEKNVV